MGQRTELKPEFLSVAAVNSFVANNSSSRVVMDNSHISSRPSLVSPDEKVIKSGTEYELGKYINDCRVERDCVVKAVVHKYQEAGIAPPVSLLIVEYEEDGSIVLDMIEVNTYKSNHGFFGYDLEYTDDMHSINYNTVLPEGTLLAKTASYGREGSYDFGLNVNMAFMSNPSSVANDGVVVSESFCERAKFTNYTKSVINIDAKTIPLNLNGDNSTFRFIPDIGEAVSHDGLLCGTRDRNDWFAAVDLSDRNLQEFDDIFDIATYVPVDSVVVDINVIKGCGNKPEFSSKMTEQLDRYAEMNIAFYTSFLSKLNNILNEKKTMYGKAGAVRYSPRLSRFVTDSTIRVESYNTGKTKLSYRKLPITQYRVEVITRSVVKPDLGFKLAGLHGDKGVICRILPDSHMPVDELGNRAEIVTDNISTISRTNIGRAYELYLTTACRDNTHRLQKYFIGKYSTDFLNKLTAEDLEYVKNYLAGFYNLINPEMTDEFLMKLDQSELHKHVIECLTRHIYIYYPTDNMINIVDVVKGLEASIYKPYLGKVSFIDELGKQVVTKDNIRIGQTYVMAIDKIANDYLAVSSARVNNFGFPVKGSNLDKKKHPHSLTPTKIMGETEVRIMTSFADPELVAELFDQNQNPITHKNIIRHLLETNDLSVRKFDIDRTEIPYGQTKALGINQHAMNAYGIDIEVDKGID